MPFTLILNKGDEEIVSEYDSMEKAFDEAQPWIMKGYTSRVTDKEGVVKYTQVLQGSVVAVFQGDHTEWAVKPQRTALDRIEDASLEYAPLAAACVAGLAAGSLLNEKMNPLLAIMLGGAAGAVVTTIVLRIVFRIANSKRDRSN